MKYRKYLFDIIAISILLAGISFALYMLIKGGGIKIMKGKEYNAVVYSEYSGDTAFDEQDRCTMDKVVKDLEKDGSISTFAKLDMKAVDEGWKTIKREKWFKLVRDKAFHSTTDEFKKFWLSDDNQKEVEEIKNTDKGEKILLKIIVKNKETGKKECINIPKEMQNNLTIKALKPGMYLGKGGCEYVEIAKIVDNRPKAREVVLPLPFNPYHGIPLRFNPWSYWGSGRCAEKSTSMKEYIKNAIEIREERKKYQERPYFNVKLDPIKGRSDGKENLEKMKFPCWCIWRCSTLDKHHIGMLVTGFPNNKLEYQLIDVGHQSEINACCSVDRNVSLEKLITRWNVEVIKGESQLWKVGNVNV